MLSMTMRAGSRPRSLRAPRPLTPKACSAREGEQCAGSIERALLVCELALERAGLGGPCATADARLGESLLDLGHALLVLAQRDRERADRRLRRLLRRARGRARALAALAAASGRSAFAAARRPRGSQLREHLVARGAERLPELLVVGAARASRGAPFLHLCRQGGLGDGRVERLHE